MTPKKRRKATALTQSSRIATMRNLRSLRMYPRSWIKKRRMARHRAAGAGSAGPARPPRVTRSSERASALAR